MFRNMKIGARLGLCFGAVVVVMIAVNGFTIYKMRGLSELTARMHDHPFTVRTAIGNAESDIIRMHRSMKDVSMMTSLADRQAAVKMVDQLEDDVYQNMGIAKEQFLGDPQEIENALSIFTAWKPIRDEVIALVEEGQMESAQEITRGKGAEHVDTLEEAMHGLIEFADSKAVEFEEEAKNTGEQTLLWTSVLMIAALIGVVVLSVLLVRSINGPLKLALNAVDCLTMGNTDIAIEVTSKDELGQLLLSMQKLAESSRGMAAVAHDVAGGDLTVKVTPLSDEDTLGHALTGMVQNLREQIRETMEGADILASSANEITALTAQLVAATAESSTALSQTTTTVEELRQTAQASNEKAKQISKDFEQTTQISQAGDRATEDTVKAMDVIKEQMESIAESIVRLSEQSQAVGEIISTVDDIAEQSNLLAVNAAVEAARAGEQGKGFAVVAEEIKSLAEQSKRATGQVRTILKDIQKATSTAVMVTEQGGKVVDTGAEHTAKAGEAIRALTGSVSESAQAATQIAAASQQQLVGMEQITSAMENVKQASEQNLAGTKQLEDAAQNLDELGRKLQELVQRYKI